MNESDPSPESFNPSRERLQTCILEACETVGAFIDVWGFKAIQGKVWALLAVSAAPMSQALIADRLGVSRSLVNLTISELLDFGLVRATGTHRNAPYEARMDVWATITEVLRGREWMLMERARVALNAAIHAHEDAGSYDAHGPYNAERLKILLAMTEFAQSALSLVLALRIPAGAEDMGRWLVRAQQTVTRFRPKFP
jgi:DNA-binding transcriptional regulator GbsR (MarR family)